MELRVIYKEENKRIMIINVNMIVDFLIILVKSGWCHVETFQIMIKLISFFQILFPLIIAIKVCLQARRNVSIYWLHPRMIQLGSLGVPFSTCLGGD